MGRLWWVGLVTLAACGDYEVRQADLVAWRAVPVIELERHPEFSSMPLEKRPLSDGSELWVHTNCGSSTTPVNCTSAVVYGKTQTTCGGGQTVTQCCHHQFVVRASMVEEYRPVGDCMTNCSRRPGGACK